MKSRKNSDKFIKFLKDDKFILWKLLSTDQMNKYWKDYIKNNPDEKDDILLAEEHFKEINLSSPKMPGDQKDKLTKQLQNSIRRHNHKLIIRRVTYSAACIAVLLVSLIYFQKDIDKIENTLAEQSNYIISNELDTEDILFVTGSKTTHFQNNIDLIIDGSDSAQAISNDENTSSKEIVIEQNTINKLIVPYGKRSKVILPDGTQVWLNSGSILEFPSTFSESNREVSLSGEIYIDVTTDNDKPFYVHTSDYSIRVYGTKFNVSSYAESKSSVVLVEGSIGLSASSKDEVMLLPNEMSIYNAETSTFDTQEVEVGSLISWKDGYLTFDDTPITDALKMIERYYNLSFHYSDDDSFKELTCTGKIILSDNLENVMTALSLISGTDYNKEDKKIYLNNK